MTTTLPRCPSCQQQLIQRVYGPWCRFCRGWYVEYRKPGGKLVPFIRTYFHVA